MEASIIKLNDNCFVAGVSDLEQFRNSPQRIEHLLILFCIKGEADILLNVNQHHFLPQMPWIILPDNIISVEKKSEDFQVRYCYARKNYFDEVTLRVSPLFFEFVQSTPPDYRDARAIHFIHTFFRMIMRIQRETNHCFREEIFKNCLQNYLYELYDKTHQFYASQQQRTYHQPEVLFKQFMNLIKEHYKTHHDVQFYADKMCITTRYLTQITNKITNLSPKKVVCEYVILEIRQRLKNSTLSIQEIANDLNFNDQFTMGRMFKQYTKMTPTEYRKGK